MKIGIDISQTAYKSTGVANYLTQLVQSMIDDGSDNEYLLFYSSFRKSFQFSIFNFQSKQPNVKIKIFKFPPTFLDIIWNRLHIFPIESFIGDIDIFITSDWTEPPTKKAKKVSILYDLIIYKHPQETDRKIVETQKRKHKWMKKESSAILCISKSAKKDAEEILKIPENKLYVIYPGATI